MPKVHQIVGAPCNGGYEKEELKAKDILLFLKITTKTVSSPITANIQWEVCKRYQTKFSNPSLKFLTKW